MIDRPHNIISERRSFDVRHHAVLGEELDRSGGRVVATKDIVFSKLYPHDDQGSAKVELERLRIQGVRKFDLRVVFIPDNYPYWREDERFKGFLVKVRHEENHGMITFKPGEGKVYMD